jgi:hypothetical protein
MHFVGLTVEKYESSYFKYSYSLAIHILIATMNAKLSNLRSFYRVLMGIISYYYSEPQPSKGTYSPVDDEKFI